ncbi:MAG: hypothetical protein AB1644_12075 [Candidatus Zixiibacteriota bacterium]
MSELFGLAPVPACVLAGLVDYLLEQALSLDGLAYASAGVIYQDCGHDGG